MTALPSGEPTGSPANWFSKDGDLEFLNSSSQSVIVELDISSVTDMETAEKSAKFAARADGVEFEGSRGASKMEDGTRGLKTTLNPHGRRSIHLDSKVKYVGNSKGKQYLTSSTIPATIQEKIDIVVSPGQGYIIYEDGEGNLYCADSKDKKENNGWTDRNGINRDPHQYEKICKTPGCAVHVPGCEEGVTQN